MTAPVRCCARCRRIALRALWRALLASLLVFPGHLLAGEGARWVALEAGWALRGGVALTPTERLTRGYDVRASGAGPGARLIVGLGAGPGLSRWEAVAHGARIGSLDARVLDGVRIRDAGWLAYRSLGLGLVHRTRRAYVRLGAGAARWRAFARQHARDRGVRDAGAALSLWAAAGLRIPLPRGRSALVFGLDHTRLIGGGIRAQRITSATLGLEWRVD